MGESRLLFIPRHGPGHRFSPSEINYRANVFALKAAGATRVLSVSAVGSLKDGLSPGDYVLVDQFIDKTFRRASTFFGDGVVGHVAFAEPTCASLGAAVTAAALEAGIADTEPDARTHEKSTEPVKRLHRGGTYVCMEGPQFSSRAESLLHRSWGADVIGMTAATEAKLCREAELCFASLALVTDYDAWHAEEAAVTAAAVVEVLRANVAGAKAIIRDLPHHAAEPHGMQLRHGGRARHSHRAGGDSARGTTTPESPLRERHLSTARKLRPCWSSVPSASTPSRRAPASAPTCWEGAASYFSVAASFLAPVRAGRRGRHRLPGGAHGAVPRSHQVDLAGLERVEGRTFRWSGRLRARLLDAHDARHAAQRLLRAFGPSCRPRGRDSPYVFLANIDPALQLSVLIRPRRPARSRGSSPATP